MARAPAGLGVGGASELSWSCLASWVWRFWFQPLVWEIWNIVPLL